jgi:hypothetical protein
MALFATMLRVSAGKKRAFSRLRALASFFSADGPRIFQQQVRHESKLRIADIPINSFVIFAFDTRFISICFICI